MPLLKQNVVLDWHVDENTIGDHIHSNQFYFKLRNQTYIVCFQYSDEKETPFCTVFVSKEPFSYSSVTRIPLEKEDYKNELLEEKVKVGFSELLKRERLHYIF